MDFVKNGVKQDTMNLFRNAPLFGYGLFPDAAIVTEEQDIQKQGARQHTSWRGSHRYCPYERRDKKASTFSDQTSQQQQSWRQFSRNLEGVGVDEVPTLVSPSLTSISHINDNYWVGPTPIQVAQVQLDL